MYRSRREISTFSAAMRAGFGAHRQTSPGSNRILTRLYGAAVKVKTQSTKARPQWRSFRTRPTLFPQPKPSSTFLRCRLLSA